MTQLEVQLLQDLFKERAGQASVRAQSFRQDDDEELEKLSKSDMYELGYADGQHGAYQAAVDWLEKAIESIGEER